MTPMYATPHAAPMPPTPGYRQGARPLTGRRVATPTADSMPKSLAAFDVVSFHVAAFDVVSFRVYGAGARMPGCRHLARPRVPGARVTAL
jgi:hypothetical protein